MAKLFAQLYAQGDIQAFMEMFDEGARTESGGALAIRQDYETFFNGTQSRWIGFTGLTWEKVGDQWRGSGNYTAIVQLKHETFKRQYMGTMRMAWSDKGGVPKLTAFYHKANGQSGD